MSNTSSEITELFKQLALQLKSRTDNSVSNAGGHENEEDQNALDFSISKLNRSFNLNEDNSRVRVLDAALSLLCFKAPQVFDSVIEYQVKTIVSVLSASIGCRVLRSSEGEVLQVGSSICLGNVRDLIGVCVDVIEKLKSHGGQLDVGMLCQKLLGAVLRTAASSSSYQHVYPCTLAIDVKPSQGRSGVVSKLCCHLHTESSFKSSEIPLRLLSWYLDPATLESDITNILRETMDRPFFCLSKEFHEKKDWRCIITCLVLSPVMFIETRALLHKWLLMTGLASILEFLIELVSVVLDVVSRPTRWGIPMELAIKIPFSKAYFPYKIHLLQTLAGFVSFEGLLRIVQATSRPVSHARRRPESNVKPTDINIGRIDHKSIWALAVNFPNWFHFASLLLLYGKEFEDKFCSYCTQHKLEVDGVEQSNSALAARYIAWVLSPTSKSYQDFLIDGLITISESWTLKQSGSSRHGKQTAGSRKRLKKPNSSDQNKECNYRAISLWLEEFNSLNIMVSRSASSDPNSSNCLSLHQNVLFRKLPLGIFIGYLNHIDDHGCELLLHYAATGRVLQLSEITSAALGLVDKSSESQQGLLTWGDEVDKEEAVAGARLVFVITDLVESMYPSLFESEESGLDFICQVKIRAGKYLIKCLNKLIQTNVDEDGSPLLMDLFSRLTHWKNQGRNSQYPKELDYTIDRLCHKLYST